MHTELVVWSCALLLVDLFIPRQRKYITALLAAAGLVVALALVISQFGQEGVAFSRMVILDGFALFLQVLFLASGLAGIALAYDYNKRLGIERGEYYTLLLLSIAGMMMMSMAADLIMVFLALEWLSIPLYVLAGFMRDRVESEEAGLKYFLLGAYSGGFVLYGTALIFGATGSTALPTIATVFFSVETNLALLAIGAAMVIVGIGFKVSAVPFHMWTPDVYHGAPSAVTGFMSVAAKAAGFAALLRVFVVALPMVEVEITPLLWMLAVLTMILGNVAAIAQSNIKRMLAYSSIAHAGYILMALVSYARPDVTADAVAAALVYLVAYAFTSFGAWAVVVALEKSQYQGLNLEDYAGLGRKHPALAAAMAIFMLSFTGVPPTLGFIGKFYLFATAIQGGQIALAVIGVLTSLISAYYYLRLIVIMYMHEGNPQARSEPWLNLTVYVSAAAVVVMSLFANPLFNWATNALLRSY
ncbi:MAG: NADH-quinone oxidoreductase subunit N [Anaerolineales bacterium]|nr:NADH-quinone oxidoreductase subunit N [Anaerolineales bacterium]